MYKLNSLFNQSTNIEYTFFLKYVVDNLDKFNYTWHPVGFIVIRLGIRDDFNYRLHIWPIARRTPKNPDWPIHNHIFDLESHIICGELLNRNYSLKLGNEETSKFSLYEVEYSEGGSTITKTYNYVNSIDYQDELIKSNNSYFIPKGVFHESIVDPLKLTCTIARTTIPDNIDKALILGRKDAKKLYDCPDKNIKKSDLIAQIRNVIEKCKYEKEKSLAMH